MQFIKAPLLILTMTVFSGYLLAQQSANQKSNDQQAAEIVARTAKMVELQKQKMAENGDMKMFSEAEVAKQVKRYENAAKLISDYSMASLSNTLTTQMGMDPRLANSFSSSQSEEEALVKGIFISFSMTDAQILEAMKAAVKDGGQIYLNGIAKDHKGIHDTIRKLQAIGVGLEAKPDVRFQPKKFEKYDVKLVPTIIYSTPERTVYAKGILNLQWLKTKHGSDVEAGNLGNYGAVYDVEEESIIETFRKRMASFDWDGKKEKAISGFWGKQSFDTLPKATKSEIWYIDPTVRIQKDITTPQGQVLGKAGQIINPIKNSPAPLTIYAFDPTDVEQLQWAHNRVNNDNDTGQVMLMFSKINKQKGWDHLSTLRNHFGRELYKLPKELIKKFDLKALPVKVSTDVKKGVFKIEQVNVGESK